MSWAKLDDGLEEHGKIDVLFDGHVELGMLDGDALQELAALASIGLWTLSLSNSARRLTDGHVTRRVLRSLAPATHSLLADRLVEIGLFETRDAGAIQIHDYLDHNPSREKVLEQRAARAEAGRKGGERSGEVRRAGQALTDEERRRRTAAAARANTALKAGRIQHGPCVKCGEPGEEMHHFDYDLPEQIVWYCRNHHKELHQDAWREAAAEASANGRTKAPAEDGAEASASAGAVSSGKPRRTPSRTRTRTPVETPSLVEPDGPTQDVAPDIARLSRLLADLICERDPKARSRVKPDSQGWLTAIRLLIKDRDGDVDEVERVLRWSQADPFWQTNVLCPGTLRRQFVQLAQKSKAPANGQRPTDPARDARRARGASALQAMLAGEGNDT